MIGKKIVIQCATPPEFMAFRTVFANAPLERVGKRQFIHASANCFVLWGAVGKVWAAASAEFAITHWKPDFMIDFGAAGALASGLAVGDLVVAEKVVEHDISSARPFRPAVMAEHRDLAPRYPLFETLPDGFRITRGCVAAGDKDIQTLEERSKLAADVGAIAATWESSAIGRICIFHDVPFLSLRVITDLGGTDEFLAEYKKNLNTVLVAAVKVIESLVLKV